MWIEWVSPSGQSVEFRPDRGPYKLVKRDGLGENRASPSTARGYGRYGESLTGLESSARVITLALALIASDRVSYWSLRSRLTALHHVEAGDDDLPQPGTLRFHREDEGVSPGIVEIQAVPRESPQFDTQGPLLDLVDLEYVAPDPLFTDPSEQQLAFALSGPGGVVFPTVFPVVWSPSGLYGNQSVTNDGATAWPRYEIRGPGTNPVIENLTTGERLSFYATLNTGDTLVVETAPDRRTDGVTLSGPGWTKNALALRASGSRFPRLAPGPNALRVSMQDAADGGVVVRWNPRLAGI